MSLVVSHKTQSSIKKIVKDTRSKITANVRINENEKVYSCAKSTLLEMQAILPLQIHFFLNFILSCLEVFLNTH